MIVYCTNYTFRQLNLNDVRRNFPSIQIGPVWRTDISDIISKREEDNLLSKKLLLSNPEVFLNYLKGSSLNFSFLKYHVFRDCDAMLSDYVEKEMRFVGGKEKEVIIETRPNSGVTHNLDNELDAIIKRIEILIRSIRVQAPWVDYKKKDELLLAIVESYWLEFNPDRGFKEHLLSQLGMQKCKVCEKRKVADAASYEPIDLE